MLNILTEVVRKYDSVSILFYLKDCIRQITLTFAIDLLFFNPRLYGSGSFPFLLKLEAGSLKDSFTISAFHVFLH